MGAGRILIAQRGDFDYWRLEASHEMLRLYAGNP